jgi:Putative Ig domain
MAANDSERLTRDVENAVTYPILTEQVSFPRSGGGPTTGISSSPTGAGLGQTAALAIGDVLGWKVSSTDPKGFVGALTQAFTLTDVEGHVESTWNPRTYAVQTDLGGGITGAQASLYTRAKDALDQSLSLLDGLYPLDPEADPEYVRALREMARSQMTEIVREFGTVGLPSVLRIDTYFEILLGQNPKDFKAGSNSVQFDPDQINGTLGQLRDTYGIKFRGNPFNNSIEDEQDITNFRVISDYMTSLMQSWIANRPFFFIRPKQPAFFGTQLVLISRQLNVIGETVDELRFVLDSVFIGPNERQALLLKFDDHAFPPMFLEDVLVEIENFVKDEGPRLLRDGGKISVTNNILPVVRSLRHMVDLAHKPTNRGDLPDGFGTARVSHSLDDLEDQLGELIKLTEQVEQEVPPSEDKLRISGISQHTNNPLRFSILGGNFDPEAKVHSHSDSWTAATGIDFFSAERIDVTFDEIPLAEHEIKVTNPDGEFATFPLDLSNKAAVRLLSTAVVVAPSATLPIATVGSSYSQKLPASMGSAPHNWSISVSDLPAGLTLSPAGDMLGSPTKPGSYSFSAIVNDSRGTTFTQPLNLVVALPFSISTTSLPGATEGASYLQDLGAQGGTAPYNWTVPPGSLPPGLSLSSTGQISGTPTGAGTYSFAVTINDSRGSAVSQALSIVVAPPFSITTTSLPGAVVGSSYSQNLNVQGGTAPYNWTVPISSLPAGLKLTPGGQILGTPTTPGSYSFSATVNDSKGSAVLQPLNIVVAPPFSITTTNLPDATVGAPYPQKLAATDGTPPYTWSIVTGSLPAGLTLSAVGDISGTPTTAGPSSFSVTVTDSGGSAVSQALSIAVAPPFSVTTTALGGAIVGSLYQQDLRAQGGAAPYNWSALSGSLPPGLRMNASGQISGTPTMPGSYSFAVTVNDNRGSAILQPLTIMVASRISVTPGTMSGARVGVAYSRTLKAQGGTAPYKWKAQPGSLPSGLKLSAGGIISGKPKTKGSQSFSVTVNDRSGATTTRTLKLTVK